MNTRFFRRVIFSFIPMSLAGALLAPIAAAGNLARLGSSGETVTVTTLNDVSDFANSQQVVDLPGPDGQISFREAVTAANNTTGPQTIAFAIPTSEFWLISNMALLRLEVNAFFLQDSETTVDFSTQTTNIGDTNPNGPEVGIYGLEPNGWGIAAIFINGDNCVVKGLGNVYQRGYAVRIVGSNNRVISCNISGPLNSAVYIGGYMGWPAPTANTIGGTSAEERNTLSGVQIAGPAENNMVIGNHILSGGVTVQGAPQYGVYARNNRIGGATVAERNVISGVGRYGEEGFPLGTQVSVIDADNTIVENNFIGTTIDGMSRYRDLQPTGIEVRDARGTIIRNNLIAGLRAVGTNHYAGQIFGEAILVNAVNFDAPDTVIHDNTIGLAADGITPITTRSGIKVIPMIATRHAFRTAIRSNHIARVETTGIAVGAQENGITISGNSIHDCGGLGIDLFAGSFGGTGGVTSNDAGDGDVGGNGLQNFPVLLSASSTGAEVTIQGTLDTVPSESFIIEFFASPSGDPSGFGEGARFLGFATVATNSAGQASFSVTLPVSVAAGEVATATATRVSTGDTSEFSAWITLSSSGFSVAPDSYTVPWGIPFEGNLAALALSDDQRFGIYGSVNGARTSPNVQVVVSGTSPIAQPSELSFRLEAQSNLLPTGQVIQRIELFNFASSQWVQVDQRFATLGDSVVSVAISSNASQYVDATTRNIRARLTWRGGTQLSRTRGAKIDQCRWWVN